MVDHQWPGNVRELIATMRRAVVLANEPLIDVRDLRLEPEFTPVPARYKPAARQRRQNGGAGVERGSTAERQAVLQALQQSRFNMTRAAGVLGVSRATLYRMLQRNQIELAQQFLVRDSQLGAPEI
jgi:DNA-binding NtrC family response regulator